MSKKIKLVALCNLKRRFKISVIVKRTKRSILRTDICRKRKQQSNWLKFGIIIHAPVCNQCSKFELYRRVKFAGVALYFVIKILRDRHFVGQKRNKINRFSPISQYSNQVFENEEQLLNIDIEHIRQF